MEKIVIFLWIISIIFSTYFLFRSIIKAFKEAALNDATIKRILDGKKVFIKYALSDKKGNILDAKHKDEAFVYLHGEGQILAGLEKRLHGLKVGKIKKIVVPVKEAY